MNKLLLVLSIIATVFIIIFFIVQVVLNKNNEEFVLMPGILQMIFGIGFLIISICVFVFLIIAWFGKINLPTFIEVNIFEIFITAVIMAVVSFFLIFKQ